MVFLNERQDGEFFAVFDEVHERFIDDDEAAVVFGVLDQELHVAGAVERAGGIVGIAEEYDVVALELDDDVAHGRGEGAALIEHGVGDLRSGGAGGALVFAEAGRYDEHAARAQDVAEQV